jgi:MFS family permease
VRRIGRTAAGNQALQSELSNFRRSAAVIYRLIQGVCGAGLVPLSQSVLLQINPPERHGQAVAIWGTGVMLGPILARCSAAG